MSVSELSVKSGAENEVYFEKDPMKPQRASPGLVIKTRFEGKYKASARSWKIIFKNF